MTHSQVDTLQRIENIALKMRKKYSPELAQEKFNRFLGNIIIPWMKNTWEMFLTQDNDHSSNIVDIFHDVASPHIETIQPNEIPAHHSPIFLSGMQVGSFFSDKITESVMKKYVDSVMLILADMHLDDSKMTEQMAYYDSLTWIPNRLSLISNTKQMIHSDDISDNIQDPFSVILFDVDFFKKINEKYGHDGWDEALKFIAVRLSEYISTKFWNHQDTSLDMPFFGRLWGEEFLIVLPWVSSLDAKKIADDLVFWIAKNPVAILDPKKKKLIDETIQISAGISSYNPEKPIDAEELRLFVASQKAGWNRFPPAIGYMIKLADEAGQWAKEHGRNQAIHYEDRKTVSQDTIEWNRLKMELENLLRWIISWKEILRIITEFLQKNNS